MCGGGGSPPPVVQRDPKAEALQAANEAAVKANTETAGRRQRSRRSSLLASGAMGVAQPAAQSVLATAKGVLGA